MGSRTFSKLTTQLQRGQEEGAFQVDVLTHPVENPWFAQIRMTGLDFYPDGDSLVVSCWDGDVLESYGSNARRRQTHSASNCQWVISSQAIKIVDDLIYVGCRDQICILHDLNHDGETDFYESFNSDHQVTDHFHEFAMGLCRWITRITSTTQNRPVMPCLRWCRTMELCCESCRGW